MPKLRTAAPHCRYYLFLKSLHPLLARRIRPHQVELGLLESAYKRLMQQKRVIFTQRLWYVMLEQFLMKYVWSGAGMVIVSIPLLTGRTKDTG